MAQQSITLQTSDSDVVSGDVLGRVNFAASNESSGSEAKWIGASVYAEASGEFTASVNPTNLVFATSDADGIVARHRVTNVGHFVPLLNTTYNLGASNLKYNNIFAATGTLDRVVATGIQLTGSASQSGLLYINNSNLISSSPNVLFSNADLASPKLIFKASGTTTPDLSLNILTTASGTTSGVQTLSIQGSAGELFSITDVLDSGTIFSVNDISGLSLIEADASGVVTLVRYGTNVAVGDFVPTQKLHVGGNLRVSGAYFDSSNLPGTSGHILVSTSGGTSWRSLNQLTGVDGSGTAGYVARWTDTDTIGSGLIFDNGTNIGIGTASPAQKLSVFGGSVIINKTTADNDKIFIGSNLADAGANDRLQISPSKIKTNANTSSFTITGDNLDYSSIILYGRGNATNSGQIILQAMDANNVQLITYLTPTGLGIGQATPTARLHVQAGSATATGVIVRAAAAQTADLLQIQNSAGTTLLDIDAAGSLSGVGSGIFMQRLGVATSNPSTNLEVFGTSRFGGTTAGSLRRIDFATDGVATFSFGDNANANNFIIENLNTTCSTDHGNSLLWRFGTNASSTPINAGRISVLKEQQWTSTASTQDSYLAIALAENAVLGEKLRITSAGNVGIGTINPTAQLQINSVSATTTGVIVRGAASQTADLQQWQNSAGTALVRVDAAGSISGVASGIFMSSLKVGSVAGDNITRAYIEENFTSQQSIGLRVRGTGSSSSIWKGRIVAGGDNVAFLMGEYISQAWLGGHNAALNAWAPLRINPDGTTDLYLGNTGAAGANPIVTIKNNDGNVGIGIASPTQRLHVSGNMRLTGALFDSLNLPGASGQVLVSTSGGVEWRTSSGGSIDGTGSANYLARWIDADTLGTGIVYDNGTNVGIGTASPSTRLHIRRTSGDFIRLGVNDANANGVGGNIEWYTNEAVSADYLGGLRMQFSGGIANSNRQMQFLVGDVTTPKAIINGTGNMGIGTTSPSARLDIRSSGVAGLIVQTSNAQNIFQYLKEDQTNLWRGLWDGSNFHHYLTSASLYYNLNNGNFTIDGGGGVNTSCMSFVNRAYIQLNSLTTNAPGNANIWAGANAYAASGQLTSISPFAFSTWAWNGIDGFTITSRGYLVQTQQSATTGDARLSIARGTDSTELFTVNYSGGNVGIGQTSPTARLHVQTSAATITGVIVRGATSQTADLQQWQNSAGTMLASVTKEGNISYNTSSSLGLVWGTASLIFNGQLDGVTITPYQNTYVGLSVKGQSAQTGDLQQWKTSGGTVLARVDAAGSISGVASGVFMQRVGIGTSNPSYPLDVNGNAYIAGSILLGGYAYYGARFGTYLWANADTTIQTSSGYGIGFNVHATEIARITSSGLGIGTTSPTRALDVRGSAFISGALYDSTNSAGTNGQVLTSTATGTDWKSLSEIVGVDGVGTSGYVARWIDGDTIGTGVIYDNGTNVGVRTTAPSTTLDVRGTGYFSESIRTSGTVVFASGNTGTAGVMQWNDGEGGVDLGLKGGNVIVNIGQDNVVLCYNGTGSSLSKGQVVYASGAQGQRPSVNLALATSDISSARTIGLVDETIGIGAEGFVATFGVITNLNTSALTAGSGLWLSATTPGAITMTRPVAPNHGVFLGWCLNSHVSAGRVFVNVQNGAEIEELHDVLIQNVASGDVLQYDSSNLTWRNRTRSQAGLVEGVGTSGYAARWISANVIGTGVVYDNGTNVGIGTTSPTARLQVNHSSVSGLAIIGSHDRNLYIQNDGSSTGILLQHQGQNRFEVFTTGTVFINKSSTNAIKSLAFYDPIPSLYEYNGFGSTSGAVNALRYNVVNSNFDHIFFRGDSGASSTELMRIRGNRTVGINTAAPEAMLHVTPTGTTATGIIVRGVASQTADLLQIQNSASTTLLDIDAAGSLSGVGSGVFMQRVGAGTSAPTAQLHVNATTATTTGVIVRGATSQTADLFQAQNSAGTALVRVDAAGSISGVASGLFNYIGLNNPAKLATRFDILETGVKTSSNPIFNIRDASTVSNAAAGSIGYSYIPQNLNHNYSGIFTGFRYDNLANCSGQIGLYNNLGYSRYNYGTLTSIENVAVNGYGSYVDFLNDANAATLSKAVGYGMSWTGDNGAYSNNPNIIGVELNINDNLNEYATIYGLKADITFGNGSVAYGFYITGAEASYLSHSLGLGRTIPSAKLDLVTNSNNEIGIITRGSAAQTADLQQWLNSASGVLLRVDAAGSVSGVASGIFGQNLRVANIPAGSSETDVVLVKTDGTFVKRPSSSLGVGGGSGISNEDSIINALIFG